MKKRILKINGQEYQAYSGFLYDVNYYIRLQQYTNINANEKCHLEIDKYGWGTIGWKTVATIKVIGYKNTFKSYTELQNYLDDTTVFD